MLAIPDFADMTQTIGLASLGASDEEITALSSVYWFSVEFGLVKEGGQRKIMGAGILSSFGEMENAMSDIPEVRSFVPEEAARTSYPITTYQPILWMADDMQTAKKQLRDYAKSFSNFRNAYQAN